MKNTTILLLLLILAVGFTACRKGSEVTPEPKPTQLTLEEIKTKLRLTASRVSGLTLLIEDVPFTTGMDYMLANQELVLLIEKAQFTVLPGAPKVFVWKTVFKTKNSSPAACSSAWRPPPRSAEAPGPAAARRLGSWSRRRRRPTPPTSAA